MSTISCKMRNSFAIDNQGNLYSWGSWESGLLGNDAEADIAKPNLIEVTEGRDKYEVESISSGHFHVAIVAHRCDTQEPKELKYAQSLFNKMLTWYEDYFIPTITNPISFMKIMMKRAELTKEVVKYHDEFEEYFLNSFFAFQKLNNKDIFKMNKVYQDIFFEEFGLSSKKTNFQAADLNKLADTGITELREVLNFAIYCVNHFKRNPEDFPFFVRLVMKFEPFIDLKDVLKLFEYCYLGEGVEVSNAMEFEVKSKANTIYSELRKLNRDGKKEEYLVSTNELIDVILNRQTGVGVVFTWGVYAESRLGYLESKENSTPGEVSKVTGEMNEQMSIQRFPKMVIFRNIFTKILKLACGYSHTLALTDDHRVYSWGSGKYGCLGNSKSDNVDQPELIEKDFEKNPFKEITEIAAGMYFSLALENDGKVFSWGCGNNGRLGHGDENSVGHPKVISYFLYNDIRLKQLSCGDTHAAGLSTSKDLFTWGNGAFGKLGHGNFDDVRSPLQVEFFNSKKADLVVCGSQNTMVVLTDFRIFAWGKNSHGMLGVPNFVDQNILIPSEVLIQKDSDSMQISAISLGTMHSMFLFTNGSLFTCGNTVSGILAQDDVYDKLPIPKRVQGYKFYETPRQNIFIDSIFSNYNSDFTLQIQKTKYAVSMIYADCSNYNSAFVTNNGELYMCGDANLIIQKQEEDTPIESEKTPGTLGGGNTTKGKTNGMTQVNNAWSDKLVKITHSLLSEKVSYIALGRQHVICVAEKKVYSWGKNSYGMLGLTNKALGEVVTQPTHIEKIASAVKMAAVSDSHSFVLTCNGEIYAFGSNLYGKLGLGEIGKYFEYTDSLDHPIEIEPKLVKNITYADYIACSNSHSACIMKYDNKFAQAYQVFTWGSGFLGKLGHYDGGDAYEPKKVEELDSKYSGSQKLLFVKVALGDEFTIALDYTGGLWGWGRRKYLNLFREDEVDDGIISTPDALLPGMKFKFITSSNSYVMAIDVEGEVYCWGKLNRQGNQIFQRIEKVQCDKMEFVTCGTNHFVAIDGKTSIPYSWGSNLCFKCGQNFAMNSKKQAVDVEEDKFYDNPRKLEFFFDYFMKNNAQLELEKENTLKIDLLLGDEGNEGKGYHKSNPVQSAILEERLENKNIGLLSEDFKINQRFYEALEEYFRQIKAIEEGRMRESMKIENQIIYSLNKAKTLKNTEYRSEVPKIVSQNFQIYEMFLNLLQVHPCYLQKVYSLLPNKAAFIDIVKMVFGRNYLNMRNKRVILMLMGLWNSLFHEETKENSNSLKDTDRYEDYVTYDLYDLIFKINKENMAIVYDITSEIFLYFITQILDKADVTNPSKDQDVLSHYKDLGEMKKEFCTGAIKIIADKIKYLFSEMKESLKNNFTFSVIWMFKRISKLFQMKKRDKDQNMEKNLDQSFFRLFNYFLFVPFIDLLKKIKDSYDETQCQEYNIFLKRLPEVLEKNKTKNGFAQLFNLYKSNKTQIENSFFKNVCSPKSDILKQVFEIFVALAEYEHWGENEMVSQKASEEIEKMNYKCKESLQSYQYDFTLTTFKEMIKSNAEKGNESVIVPLSVRDLIQLQSCFLKLLNSSEDKQLENGPLRDILNVINDFKLDELDNNSSIQNFVMNFYIKPNSFFYIHNEEIGEPKVIKCDCCLLPIHHIFFDKNYVKEYIEGSRWDCPYCPTTNERNLVVCTNKSCGSLKSKEVIKKQQSFFKLFSIPADDEFTLLFEEVLFIMHPISDRDDLFKEIDIAMNKYRATKTQDKTKFNTLVRFKTLFDKSLGNPDDMQVNDSDKNTIIKKLYQDVDSNLRRRQKHLTYLNNIRDFIAFLSITADNAKANFNHNEKQNLEFLFKVGRGYSNEFAKEISPLTKLLKNKTYDSMNNNVIKKYLVGELIKTKVIDEILFQQSAQPKLMQKSYILFEKEPNGYRIKLNYKEKYRKFILCGVNTHEYVLENKFVPNENILEMRRSARNNPTLNLEEIRFNIFYLVRLLNSLETD